MVPKKFHRWLKVFGKVESERILVRKVWDHAIDLKEDFKVSKAKVYPLSQNERDEVQKFVNEHLKKGYIQPSKLQQISPVFCQDANSESELSLYSLLALDKENSLESLLHWSTYLYIIYLVCALSIPHSQPNHV